MVDREYLMAGTEVEHFPLPSVVAAAASEHFPSLKPADEHQLVGLRDVEPLSVHLLVRDDDLLVQALHNRMARVDHPQDLLLSVLSPFQVPGIGSAHLPEDL